MHAFFLVILGLTSTNAFAQAELNVPDITVLGNTGKSSAENTHVTSELSGARLKRKRQATLGETLAREPGVASSYFGPNASRPVIRGMEGDRVRVLEGGMGVLDASAASPDHAVAMDPLIVDRMEIVRGPATLLYGTQAMGGVVNMVSKRVPEARAEAWNGKSEVRYSSVDQGRSAGASVNGPVHKDWVLHVDGSARAAEDYEAPAEGRIFNSFNQTQTGAFGGSYLFANGFLGSAFSIYESRYGTIVEREVSIKMRQRRWDLAGRIEREGFIRSVRVKNSLSWYQHEEFEGAEVGTTFRNRGDEARIDLQHKTWDGWDGSIGLQFNGFVFGAQGEEAFLPESENATTALFLFEERKEGSVRPSFGFRAERASVLAREDARFGPERSREFLGLSAALGLNYELNARDSLLLNGAWTSRPPNYQELFAEGPHVATASYELGDADLGLERAASLELAWRRRAEVGEWRVGAFLQDTDDFVELSPSGLTDAGSGLPIFAYQSVTARLYGAELEYRRSFDGLIPGARVDMEFKVDALRGLNRDTGDGLPRMTPVRETFGLVAKGDGWQADLEVQHAEAQTQTARFETSTKPHTLVNAGAEWNPADWGVFARLNNAFDVEARSHVSIIKDIAPLPGRSFVAGLQASF